MSGSLPLQLKLHARITDLQPEVWDALVDREAAPFLEWAWLAALEESGSITPEHGWTPRHLTLWRGNKLVAAAPAYLKSDSHGEFVFDGTWAAAADRLGFRYYPKLVLGAPFTPATGRRILVAPTEDRPAREAELIRAALEYAHSEGLSGMHVLFPTRDEAERLGALGFGIRHGLQYQWHNRGYRSYEDFLERFVSKRRTQIRRERASLSEQGLRLVTLRGEELAQVDPAEVHALYASTVDKHLMGMQHLTADFFPRVLATFRHRLELVQARDRQDRVVAAAFNLRSDDVLYGRYWGSFADHPFLHFNVCLYRPVEEAILQGLSRFEPGAGGEHKLVRGFEPSLTYSAHWIFNQALDRAVREFLAHERAAIADGLPTLRQETGLKA